MFFTFLKNSEQISNLHQKNLRIIRPIEDTRFHPSQKEKKVSLIYWQRGEYQMKNKESLTPALQDQGNRNCEPKKGNIDTSSTHFLV